MGSSKASSASRAFRHLGRFYGSVRACAAVRRLFPLVLISFPDGRPRRRADGAQAHAALRPPPRARREADRFRRLGDARAVRRHPRGAPRRARARRPLRRLAHGRVRRHGPGRARVPPVADAQRRRQARGRPHPLLGVPDASRGRSSTTCSSTARSPDDYLLVVNAGNTPKDFAWATEHARGDVRIDDRSADYALIAVQGPKAAALLARVSSPDPSRPAVLRLPRHEGLRRAGARLAHGLHGRGRLRGLLPPGGRRAPLPRAARRGPARGRRALRPRRARHAAARGEDGALRQRHRRHRHARSRRTSAGSSRWTRATSSAATRSPRRRQAGVPRKLVGFEMVDRGIARHGYPAKTAAGPGRRDVRDALADARQADRPRAAADGRDRRRHRVPRRHPRPRRRGARRADAVLQETDT